MSAALALALAQIALVLAGMTAGCLILRRRVITRRGGVVECCLRSQPTGRWQHGMAEYRNGELHWHRSLSLRVRPHAAFDRRGLVVTGSRPAGSGEAGWLGPQTMIVTCQAGQRLGRRARADQCAPPDAIELAMSDGALTGYLAWLEAAPARYLSDAS